MNTVWAVWTWYPHESQNLDSLWSTKTLAWARVDYLKADLEKGLGFKARAEPLPVHAILDGMKEAVKENE